MKTRRLVLAVTVACLAIAATFLLITSLASAKLDPESESRTVPDSGAAAAPAADRAAVDPPVTFPGGDWPWYAQEEISVHPEPPIAGHPTDICAEVVNHDPVRPHTVTLVFSVANFGIGVPFTPVGHRHVVVPPGGHAKGCVIWVPPVDGHWCIQVHLKQPGWDDLVSQRNIDIFEPLVPGEPHHLEFPVGPLETGGTVTLTTSNVPDGWDVSLDPPRFSLDQGQVQTVTLTTYPPGGAVLGSRRPVVDVEGYLNGEPLGGFRKFDWPPVPLHRPKDPIYAETEISVRPYPPRAGEPTQICAELRNLTGISRTVEVLFFWANFGIGLPWHPINGPLMVTVPPHGWAHPCITWIPPFDGHFCVQARLQILDPRVQYEPQISQRNIDVGEPLRPGEEHSMAFPVRNPTGRAGTLKLELIQHLPDWEVSPAPGDTVVDMQPGSVRSFTLTVRPPPDQPLPADGTVVIDVEGHINSELIGGFRKIVRPPVPLHQPDERPFSESEISIDPYPPRAHEPTELCVELRNPTPVPQDVEVQFLWANFGIGLPWRPINGLRPVHLVQ